MIEPSSADHRVPTLNGNGVCLLELFATNAIDQSCPSSARSMSTNAASAPMATIHTYVRPATSNLGRRRESPTPSVAIPPSDATKPRMIPADPRAAFIGQSRADDRRTAALLSRFLGRVGRHAVGVLLLVLGRVLDEHAVAGKEGAAAVPVSFEDD